MTDVAAYWLSREHYRRQFGLSASQMDAEPQSEVIINQFIWKMREKYQLREQRRTEQRGKSG